MNKGKYPVLQIKRINIIFFLFFCGKSAPLWGQFRLSINTDNENRVLLEEKFDLESTFTDSASIINRLAELIHQLHDRSYLEAAVDTFSRVDSMHYRTFVHVGPAYDWIILDPGNIPKSWLGRAGFRERLFREKPFSFGQYRKLREEVMREAENNGYPFASVRLDSIRFDQSGISARLHVDKDSLVLLGGLKVESEVKISDLYLQNYLGIKTGAVYDQARILKIADRVRELPFLETRSDPTITFLENRAQVNLLLKKKRSSKFDFIIGILPNNQETGRLLVTGDFTGELLNQFGQGERIYAAFEQLRPETQRLDLQFNYPYLLNLPFGFDAKFNLYKRDSTYVDLEYDIGIQYLLEGGNYLKAFWKNRTSNLLAINEDRILARMALPQSLDYSNATFGLEFLVQKLDYRFNPRRGWSVFFKGGAGTKRVKPNSKIVNLELGFLYDSLQLKTFQYQLDFHLEGFVPMFNRSTIKLGLKGGAIIAEAPIYLNEQYRIGGNQVLRGFDEESIFATNFGVLTAEYRILIGQNSYLYTFGDFAYVENLTNDVEDIDRIIGFGAGITFETKVGLFGLSLAYGKTKRIPFDFGTPKMHFGYVSLF